ncbi:MAG: FHA domain-containing protein [Planctomycetes bacterium]|nr:FHA domain-containing protein [Planctomycetota bacterium]
MTEKTERAHPVYQLATSRRTLVLRSGELVRIGRHPDNELVIDAPSVSRFHARVSWAAGTRRPVVHDLGSLNGTHVDGQRVSRGEVGEWSTVRVGQVDVSVCLTHPALIPAGAEDLACRLFDEWSPDERGHIDGPEAVQELLLALERSRRTVTLCLQGDGREPGWVTFARGGIVDVRAGGLRGVAALRDLVAHAPPGPYLITADVQPCEAPPPLSMREFLRDEARRPGSLLASGG